MGVCKNTPSAALHTHFFPDGLAFGRRCCFSRSLWLIRPPSPLALSTDLGVDRNPRKDHFMAFGDKFDADEPAFEHPGGDQLGAGAGERVENDEARPLASVFGKRSS